MRGMNAMNRQLKNAVLAASLAIIAGCGSNQVETVYIEPECELPPLPAESGLDVSELDALSDETYARLDYYIEGLIDSLNEHREMLREACAKDAHNSQTN